MSRSTSEATEQSLKYLQTLVSSEKNYSEECEDNIDNKVDSDLDVVSQKNMKDMSIYKRTPYGRIFCGKSYFV